MRSLNELARQPCPLQERLTGRLFAAGVLSGAGEAAASHADRGG